MQAEISEAQNVQSKEQHCLYILDSMGIDLSELDKVK